jgi:hypothetical protein
MVAAYGSRLPTVVVSRANPNLLRTDSSNILVFPARKTHGQAHCCCMFAQHAVDGIQHSMRATFITTALENGC